MAVLLGRRVPTPSSNLSQPDALVRLAADEALDELPGLNQEQPHGLRSKQRRRPCAGLENVDPDAMSVKPSKLSAASPNKENEEGIFSKRKVLEKEVPELALVEALRTAPPGQRYAALCGLRKALAQPRPPIANVLRCGGAELLIAALRSGASPGGRAEAAWCLVQLASGSSAQTRQLVEAGAASAAMDTLASCRDSSELCDCSLQLLANVAGDVDCSFRDGLLDAGVVNVLAQLFEEMPGFTWSGMERCAVLQSFTWLMATLGRGTPAPALEKVDSTFDFFSQVLHGTADKEMLSGALWGLCYLLEGASEEQDAVQRAERMLNAGYSEVPQPHPLLQQVVRCMRTAGDWRSPLPCAGLRLAGLLVGLKEDRFTDSMLAAGLLGALHADLVDSYAPKQVRRDAAWVLANVAGGTLDQARRLAQQPGLAEALCDLAVTQSGEVREECAWAVMNLLKHGPEMFLRLGPRVVGVLSAALMETEEALQASALDALELGLRTSELSALGVSALVPQLQECQSSDDLVLHKARLLLKTFPALGAASVTPM